MTEEVDLYLKKKNRREIERIQVKEDA